MLPGLPDMLKVGKISGFFHYLYDLKQQSIQRDILRLDRTLTRHNFYDLETMLELEHPVSKQKVLFMQADMDVVSDGSDRILDTADDVVIPGSAQFDASRQQLVWTTATGLGSSAHRVTLPAGISDAAGNVRRRPLSWRFEAGPEPYVAEVFPPSNYVQVGGTLDAIRLTFSQSVPDVSVATYNLEVNGA